MTIHDLAVGGSVVLILLWIWFWHYIHKKPNQPRRYGTGEPYNPREYWKNRENGYVSDSGASGPYR